VAGLVSRINNATAGVTASYDAVNDRFQLTSKATGDLGIALEDVTGNFLTASGLAGGTLSRGQDLLYTLNGGPQLSSHSNTITEASSSLTGLSINVLRTGSTTVEVGSDSAKIKTAINDFLTEYNKVQSLIDTQTASTTDSKGKVTAGVLAADTEADEIARQLRVIGNGTLSSLSGTVRRLSSLGIESNGTDNSLALKDATKLDAALSGNLSEIEQFFTNSTDGLAIKLGAYLEKIAGDEGSLVSRQGTISKQITAIDTQVADLERLVLSNRDRMIASFIAMEKAQAASNQQLQFLNQRFGS
jgi:flagellar hook-associated protein 2